MTSLVLPIAGKSTRFNGKPKWLERHPHGGIMLSASIAGIVHLFDHVFIIALEEQLEEYKEAVSQIEYGMKLVGNLTNEDYTLIKIKSSNSQPQTVYQGIGKHILDNGLEDIGEFMVKDCDNYFEIDDFFISLEDNFVVYAKLTDYPTVIPTNKSFITTANNVKEIINIVEKRVVSDKFVVGGYGFSSFFDFSDAYLNIPSSDNEAHMSHVVFQSMLDNVKFKAVECRSYLDWGTQDDWQRYCKEFATVFIDIDGVLFYNSAPDREPLHCTTDPMFDNIAFLRQLILSDKVTAIFTTSRTEQYRYGTMRQLQELGLEPKHLIMNLPHAQRILINDTKNHIDTAHAINIQRDRDGDLQLHLKSILELKGNNDGT